MIQTKFSGIQQRNELYKLDKKYFGRLDIWLTIVWRNPRWLADERVAKILAGELHALNRVRYRLVAYCLMSNHAHVVIDTAEHSIKPTMTVLPRHIR